MRVLVVNAGSSSLKLSLLDGDDQVVEHRAVDAPTGASSAEDLGAALRDGLGRADAVGHRIVHGGQRFRDAVVVDAEVRRALDELTDLAPLHQPPALAALDVVTRVLPDLPAVACFDTAFHATLPDAASTYALPAAWRERWGVRRFGFHGLSHAYIARRVPEIVTGRGSSLRIVSCHLGAGASLCAIAGGRSVDTTMGFTPLAGLVMATRAGDVDPGLIVWLMEHAGLAPAEVSDALEHDSGLTGLAGSGDLRELLDREAAADPGAALAVGVYLHRLRAGIAAMAAAMGGLDVLVFTGGVGEHSAPVRSRAADGLGFLGVGVNDQRNADASGDADISSAGSTVTSLVVAAREDLEIARQTRAAVA